MRPILVVLFVLSITTADAWWSDWTVSQTILRSFETYASSNVVTIVPIADEPLCATVIYSALTMVVPSDAKNVTVVVTLRPAVEITGFPSRVVEQTVTGSAGQTVRVYLISQFEAEPVIKTRDPYETRVCASAENGEVLANTHHWSVSAYALVTEAPSVPAPASIDRVWRSSTGSVTFDTFPRAVSYNQSTLQCSPSTLVMEQATLARPRTSNEASTCTLLCAEDPACTSTMQTATACTLCFGSATSPGAITFDPSTVTVNATHHMVAWIKGSMQRFDAARVHMVRGVEPEFRDKRRDIDAQHHFLVVSILVAVTLIFNAIYSDVWELVRAKNQ